MINKYRKRNTKKCFRMDYKNPTLTGWYLYPKAWKNVSIFNG